MFAKLFERESGQVLAKIDAGADDGNPEVRFFFEPPKLGVCATAVCWKDDSDESWDKAEEFFDNLTEGEAFNIADKAMAEIAGLMES